MRSLLAVPRVFDGLFRRGAYLGNDSHLGKIYVFSNNTRYYKHMIGGPDYSM